MVTQRLRYLSGQVYLGLRNNSGRSDSLEFLGNVSELMVQFQENVVSHYSSQVPERPKDEEVANQSEASITLTLEDTRKENIAIAMRGSILSESSGSASAEEHTAPAAGKYFELNKNLITSITSITSDPSGTTFVAGTDYVADPPSNLIYVPTGSALAGDPILVNYSYPASDTISAFNAQVEYYYLLYKGVNAAFDNAPVTARIFKVRFKPLQQTELISKDFEKYQLQGSVLFDSLNKTANCGGYYEETQTQDA